MSQKSSLSPPEKLPLTLRKGGGLLFFCLRRGRDGKGVGWGGYIKKSAAVHRKASTLTKNFLTPIKSSISQKKPSNKSKKLSLSHKNVSPQVEKTVYLSNKKNSLLLQKVWYIFLVSSLTWSSHLRAPPSRFFHGNSLLSMFIHDKIELNILICVKWK